MTTTRSELLTLTNADPKFYKLVGPFLGRREVHRAVGSPVWDDDDKTWLVLTNGRRVEGFLSFRPRRGVVAAESCYIAQRNGGQEDTAVRSELLKELVKVTAPSPITSMVPKTVAQVYIDAGFTELPQKSTRNYAHMVWSAQ